MAAEKKKIGLVLASIHTGISQNMWAGFVNAAAAANTSLFIFPGGRLNARQDFENLRNSVYSLVNEENLDGCISWSSSIRYAMSKEEFELFHSGFDSLPYVTLGFKSPEHPCVEFDAYNGMKVLVSHCINVHGGRKIAFLRGPDFHQSAQARFEGYYDALKEAGLIKVRGSAAFHSPLVTGHFNWEAGEAAAVQLFEERGLIPGRDFDTLIGSSDLMTLGAINYFARKGYHVPGDYHAAGFNNSAESRVTESPLSTVHLPYAEMSREAFKILLGIMGRKKLRAVADVLLNSEVIIRESCGCVHLPQRRKAAGAGKKVPRLESSANDPSLKNIEENLVKMAGDCLKLESDWVNNYVLPLIHALLYEEEDFFHLFEKALVRFFNAGLESDSLLRLISDIKASVPNLAQRTYALEPAIYRSIFKIQEQLATQTRYETERRNTVLNSLKCDLLGTRDRFSLVQNLARHLPKIGINTAAIILYSDDKTSIFAGGFSAQGISPVRDQRFPSHLLVPASLKSQYSDGIFMVQPLFIENQSLGYFIHDAPINDGVIFEELRSAVSYALKGIFLLEETVRAKRIAEQAERAKTEFLLTLENGLFNPLQGVTEKLEAAEKKAISVSCDAILDDLKDIKAFVASKETEAGSIMDFTLARIDELSLRKTVFDPEELLPKIGNFPLLLGDTARLAQCFSLIREQYGGTDTVDYSAELTYSGLSITFHGRSKGSKTIKAEKARQFSLLLAERIILMHGGDFSPDKDHCTVVLPWPTLTGQEPSKNPVGNRDHVLILSDVDFLPDGFFNLPRIRDVEKALPGKTAFIAWNASCADSGDLVKIAGLRRRSELAGIPFLCYGVPSGATGPLDSAATLIDTIEFALKSPKKGTILFIGFREYWGDDMEQLF
jgi:DNA-binding LacI/PurR family transcriptional regulator